MTGVDDPAAMEAQIGALCAELEPPVRADIYTRSLEGRSVVICAVPPIPRDQRPCHRRSSGPWAGSRIRVADGDRKLTDYEVRVLLSNRSEPQLDLTVVAYPSTDPGVPGRFGERFTENRSLDGPIPMIVGECIRVLKRNMKRRSIVSGIFRVDEWEYPEEVLREALVNALVHRDYSEPALARRCRWRCIRIA